MTEKATDHRGCLAKGFPFWNDLTPEEQEMLCRYTRPVHYAKGARVHSPLESCVGILLLRSGQLRAYLLSEDGRDVTLYRLFGGEVCILSASCVMDSVNIDLYIDAEEDTEAYCISAGIFRRLMQQNVHVRCYAYQMTAERFSDSMWTMQQVLFMSADRRLAIFLTDELAKTGGDEVRMTHDQMAKYMGSAREVVSRMLKYFAQEGWVRLFRGGVQVLDRSGLILDIFAQRARTKEGCLQVELAQYQYLLPRLIGMWSHLERQGGTGGSPIGTKGPGETQLETDRRHIRRKIDKLKEELEEVRRVRATQRQRRRKNEIPVVAIVGLSLIHI